MKKRCDKCGKYLRKKELESQLFCEYPSLCTECTNKFTDLLINKIAAEYTKILKEDKYDDEE